MKEKRGHVVLILLCLVISSIFLSSFVAAAIGSDIKGGIDSFVEAAKPIFNALLGDTPGGAHLFIKVLVFVMLIAIVGYAIRRVPGIGENALLATILQIIVALLATRFLTTAAIVEFVWLPYGALGIILSSLLPFLIIFFFVSSFDSALIRKISWVASIVIFAAIASYRWADLKTGTGSEWWQNLGWAYLIIAIISFLLLLLDKTIHRYFIRSGIKKALAGNTALLEESLKSELKDVQKALSSPDISKENEEALQKQKKKIGKAIAGLHN